MSKNKDIDFNNSCGLGNISSMGDAFFYELFEQRATATLTKYPDNKAIAEELNKVEVHYDVEKTDLSIKSSLNNFVTKFAEESIKLTDAERQEVEKYNITVNLVPEIEIEMILKKK